MSNSKQNNHQAPRHEADGIVENRETRPPVYFNLLFYGLILWGVAFSAYYLLSGWSSTGEYEEKRAAHQARVAAARPAPAAKADPAAQQAAGKALYAAHCVGCHGAEGKGGIGPDLSAAVYKYGRSPEEVLVSIRDGRPGGMPAFGNQLSAAQLDELTAYSLSLQ